MEQKGTLDVELRQEAQAALEEAHGHLPDDQETWLGRPPWKQTPELATWEHVHGHDVRTKCYAEYGCRVLEAPWARRVIDLLDRIEQSRHSSRR